MGELKSSCIPVEEERKQNMKCLTIMIIIKSLTSTLFEWGFKQSSEKCVSWFINKNDNKKYKITIEEIKETI